MSSVYTNFLYYDLYLNTAYAPHYVYITIWTFCLELERKLRYGGLILNTYAL